MKNEKKGKRKEKKGCEPIEKNFQLSVEPIERMEYWRGFVTISGMMIKIDLSRLPVLVKPLFARRWFYRNQPDWSIVEYE